MSDGSLSRRILIVAAIAGASGVLVGAFGTHGLGAILESRGYDAELIAKRSDQFDVGVRYHLIHAVALLGLSAVPFETSGKETVRRWVLRLFVAGLLLFSGSLYLLVVTNTPKLGMVTPLGGLAWILAWLMLIPLAVRDPNR
ncbi:MAG: DUF423 domain-containing protein [Rubripirellula sp.]